MSILLLMAIGGTVGTQSLGGGTTATETLTLNGQSITINGQAITITINSN